MKPSFHLASLLVLLATAGLSSAQDRLVKDPTIPPAAWLAVQPDESGGAALAANSGARLQVIVAGKTRKVAIIDGQMVKTGDTFKDVKVTQIQSNRLVMEDEAMSMGISPNMEKTAPARVTARKKVVVITGGNMPENANRSNK